MVDTAPDAHRYWPGARDQRARDVVAATGVGGCGAAAEAAGRCLTALAADLRLPPPSGDGLLQRWLGLAEVAAADLSVARLYEGHVDALAILTEAGHRAATGSTYGVWASKAGGTSVSAVAAPGGGLVLEGVRPYASGARSVDTALLTVDGPEGSLLVAVDVATDRLTVQDGTWDTIGMVGSDSATVHLDGVGVSPGDVIGPPGFYLDRPGFWPGAVGVAACWFGGAVGVIQPLVAAAVAGALDAHGLAHLGRTWADLEAASALLERTAHRFAGRPPTCTTAAAGDLRLEAEAARAVVERTAWSTTEAVARSLGPGPLTSDRVHARRVADLGVYVRQHHAERDHAELGRLLGARRW